MKLSEYIEKYGDCEVTDEIDKCIVKMPKTVYDLKYGDSYFSLTALGTIMPAIWHNVSSDWNRERIGNVFLTEEDAKFASERLKVIAELKKYAKEFSDEEWYDSNIEKYYPYYKYNDYSINKWFNRYTRHSGLYFQTVADIDIAIAAVGEEDFKKYYLGVK